MLHLEDWPEDWHPIIIPSGLADITSAATKLGEIPFVLLSPPATALHAGITWWRALVTQAKTTYPTRIRADILDCADAPALALAAIRQGQRALLLHPSCPNHPALHATVQAIAHQTHTRLLQPPPHVMAGLDPAIHPPPRHAPSTVMPAKAGIHGLPPRIKPTPLTPPTKPLASPKKSW